VYGALAGVFYIYMAATWGGFIFVCNMVAAHVAVLALVGRYSSRLHRAYTLFFIIGTLGAMQVRGYNWCTEGAGHTYAVLWWHFFCLCV